jgi:hypothetical protein
MAKAAERANAASAQPAVAPSQPTGRSTGTAPEPGGAKRTSMTPAAALKRHVEWLEYALGAATAEESYRAGRVEKASKANRDKRAARLGEVREEVEELTALLQGIRDLQAKSKSSAASRKTTRTRTASRSGRTTTTGRRTRPAGAST